MPKARKRPHAEANLSVPDYRAALYKLQVELVKLQKHIIACGDRIVVVFEGRDAAGKDGTIKHIVEHLSPREVRVVALGKPSDREQGEWYFQRYVAHLPAAGELVLFNRSWYNRAGVERVMGFCSQRQVETFLEEAPKFEALLVRAGIKLLKYYLDISKKEQKRRLKAREQDPLTQWKVSPIDEKALAHWKDYSRAREIMLRHSHTAGGPWTIVHADDKHRARLNVIRDMLSRLDYEGKKRHAIRPDREIVFPYSAAALRTGRIER